MTNRDRLHDLVLGRLPTDSPPIVSCYEFLLPERPGTPRVDSLCERGLCLVDYVDCLSTSYGGVEFDRKEWTHCGKRHVRNTWTSPVGSVSQVFRDTWQVEYFVKSPKDYLTLADIAEREVYRTNYGAYNRKQDQLGDRGLIYIDDGLRSPFQRILVDFAGVERAVTDLLFDCDEALTLYDVLYRRRLERFDLLADAPGVFMKINENISADLLGPAVFRRFHLPFYADVRARIPAGKKSIALHLDGRLGPIQDDIAACDDFDIVESLSPPPEGDSDPREVMQAWPGKRLWFSIPAQVLQPEADHGAFVDGLVADAAEAAGVDTAAPNAGAPQWAIGISEYFPERQWDRVIGALLTAAAQ